MTTEEIEKLFFPIIEETAIYKKLTNISEDKIYNWRKGRGRKPTLGEMLEVLYELGYIELVRTKKQRESKPFPFDKKGINLITGYLV